MGQNGVGLRVQRDHRYSADDPREVASVENSFLDEHLQEPSIRPPQGINLPACAFGDATVIVT
jgi:hypothetical protein